MLSKPTGFALSALFAVCLTSGTIRSSADAKEYLSGIKWEEPKIVTPGKTNDRAPSDAIVLFDGNNLDAWNNGENWKIEDGIAIVGKGGITTKQKFGDCQLHIEWSSPTNSGDAKSQQRGNSGVFFGRYELQVLDSYENKTYFDGQAGGIYKQTPPWANAMRPPGEWNTYDIIWTAPRFNEDGSLKSPAYITAIHNGVVVQNHFELQGDTPYDRPPSYEAHGKLPIFLQDHGNPVRYRNIWVREIKPPVGERVHPPSIKEGDKLVPIDEKQEVVGRVSVSGRPLNRGVLRFVEYKKNPNDARRVYEYPIQEDGEFSLQIKPMVYQVVIEGNEGVPKKYQERETSGLMVEIVDGRNHFDFELVD